MASSSGTCSGSSMMQNSGSEGDLQELMDQRKRKRMISNRESARRSRMRKQKHLDDLVFQVGHLRKENSQIITSMSITTQHYLNVEAENSILRAQMDELSHRLQSLNEMISFLNGNNWGSEIDQQPYLYSTVLNETLDDGFFMNNSCWNFVCVNKPIMATAPADMLQY
ncbi:PREDICTED: bZIP transcription factor 11 [Ipomoea nil]|uniref:bZIP transcription factor 11 n=1 Tax=Ipomoea nil TaxID=35883 RepID=UPI000901BAB3|nr:PREDICTED: bZIP transcription factor 11 [Ipomoea nil]